MEVGEGDAIQNAKCKIQNDTTERYSIYLSVVVENYGNYGSLGSLESLESLESLGNLEKLLLLLSALSTKKT